MTTDDTPATARAERADLRIVRPPAETMTRQALPQFVGISEATAGAHGLSMNLVVIPPAASAEPHTHQGYETAIYLMQGRVEVRFGPGLAQSVIMAAGEFMFIGPNTPHQPVNLSAEEPALAVVARNDPNEQEHVILYDGRAAA